MTIPNREMENEKSKLKGLTRLEGFTLLELLIASLVRIIAPYDKEFHKFLFFCLLSLHL